MVAGQIERSVVALLNIGCNSLQVQNLARSFIGYGGFGIGPAGNPEVNSISTATAGPEQMYVFDLRAAGTADGKGDSDDSEEGLKSNFPMVQPISLDEANLHLTTHLHLLEPITVTELPNQGARAMAMLRGHPG